MFGSLVTANRRRLGLTQQDLADRTGLSVRAIRGLEAGSTHHPRPGTVRILADAFGLDGPQREEFTGLALGTGPVLQPVDWLPRSLPDFTGRSELIAELSAPAPGAGPVVRLIDGMPGSGKTSLAVHLARRLTPRFPDAQLFIDLHGDGRDGRIGPAEAATTLLRQLGVPSERIPADPDGRLALWRGELAARRAVVVLDNAADSAQVTPLLPTGPAALVLVTSRRRLLDVDAAEPTAMPLLTTAEAVHLLGRVAGADRIAADPETAAEVVRRCSHLPLAIRLAAARLAHRPGWTVADLLRRLDAAPSRLEELQAENRTVTEAFAVSYLNLTTEDQRVFRLLGLYSGDWLDEPAVAALTSLPLGRAGRILAGLVDRHLVEEPVTGRFRLHDLIREYASGLTGPAGDDRAAAVTELLDHYLYSTLRATARLEAPLTRLELPTGEPRRPDLLAERGDLDAGWADTERPNLLALVRLAAEHGLHFHTGALARACGRYFFHAGYIADLDAMMTSAIPAAEALGDPSAAATAWNSRAAVAYRMGDYTAAAAALRRALAGAEAAGDRHRAGALRGNLANVYMRLGDYATARVLTEESVAGVRDHTTMPVYHHKLGLLAELTGDLPTALRHLRLEVFNCRVRGTRLHIAIALADLGRVRGRLGDHAAATRLITVAARELQRAGHPSATANARSDLAVLAREERRWAAALHLHRRAVADLEASNDQYLIDVVRLDLARTLRSSGSAGEARQIFQTVRDSSRRHGQKHLLAHAYAGLAACTTGDEAERLRRSALALYREVGAPPDPD